MERNEADVGYAVSRPKDLVSEQFRQVFREHPARVTIASSLVDNNMVGVTASSLISVSVYPPLFAISYSKMDGHSGIVAHAPMITVNLLSSGCEGIAREFASSNGRKFDRNDRNQTWSSHELGVPVLDQASAVLVGRRRDSVSAAGAMVVIYEALEVIHAEQERDAVRPSALLYCKGKFFS